MRAVRPVIGSNGIPYLQMWSVASDSTSGREKEGMRERLGGVSNNSKISLNNSSNRLVDISYRPLGSVLMPLLTDKQVFGKIAVTSMAIFSICMD